MPARVVVQLEPVRFAEYAGFGDRTAVGMGHVRLLG
jgi:CRISPR/Cas system endoribonuclease Cas6 (RAMP superfamily)